MEILADRFLRDVRGRIVDLVTGAPVRLIRKPDGEPGAAEWLDRCAALARLRHPRLAELIDFGCIGPSGRFEAWSDASPHRARAALTRHDARQLAAAVAFLHDQHLSAGVPHRGRLRMTAAGPLLAADPFMGRRLEDESTERARWHTFLRAGPDGRLPGVVLQPREAVARIVESFEQSRSAGLRCLCLCAPPGAGLTTTILLIAREARRRGYVPVGPVALAAYPAVLESLRDRHVLIIRDRRREEAALPMPAATRAIVALGVESTRPSLVLDVLHEAAGSGAVALQPLGARDLLAALRFAGAGTGDADALEGLARRAGGRPAEVLRALAARRASGGRSGPRRWTMHEAAPGYGARTSGEGPGPPAPRSEGPPESRRGAAVSLALQRAETLAGRGRHAAAERLLRAGMAALVRRRDPAQAGRLALGLGHLLLERGRPGQAELAAAEARRCFDEAGQVRGAVEAAVLLGLIRTDEGRLADAEAALRAAGIAVADFADPLPDAALALARCLYWQGRWDEARLALPAPGLPPAPGRRAARLRVRLLLAAGDLPAAGAEASVLIAAARALPPRERCSACATAALVRAAAVDVDGLDAVVREGLQHARAAHVPALALRLRVTALEGLTRAGAHARARHLAARLGRICDSAMPPLLRARLRMALAAAAPDQFGSFEADVLAFIRVSGARALERLTGKQADMDVLQQFSEVLRICHESEDEEAALHRVCASVRERLRAGSVGLFVAAEGLRAISCAGPPWPARPVTAERAVEAGVVIPPAAAPHGLEAAAPVQYAGAIVGALACRWPAGDAFDGARSAVLLSAAATACGPSLRATLDRRALRQVRAEAPALASLLGLSPEMDAVRAAVARASAAPFPVLIEGESGSGKELVARAVHRHGPRAERRFCAVNCAALPDELLEAELFGHVRGAFTGAVADRAGFFEEANGGTLFLDEISELAPRGQAKLLRVLQDGEIRRVGESFPRRVDVRLVAASNRDLRVEAAAGRFRQDLLYRLDVIRIALPPLRARANDVPLLAAHFWRVSTDRVGSRATLAPETLAALARYDWPGNVRELQNVMAALAVSAPRRGRIAPGDLPAVFGRRGRPAESTLDSARRLFEERYVRDALARAAGHRGRTARELGLSRQGLGKLMRRLGIV